MMNRRAKTAVIFLILIVLITVLHITRILLPAEDMIRRILAPTGSLMTSAGIRISSDETVKTIESCREQNKDLEQQLESVSVDYVRLRALEEENAVLRKTLGYLDQKHYDAVMAHVISRSSLPGYDTVMIDRGAGDGLENGMAVIVQDGIFIGKITAIHAHTAVLTLVSDPKSRVAIALAGSRELIGVLEGQGNRTAIATLIPQDVDIAANDILVTAGTEDKVPAHLTVGIVNRIIGEQTDPFKQAAVESLVNTDYADIVAVLRARALRPEEHL